MYNLVDYGWKPLMKGATGERGIFVLKLTVRDIEPPIWRRIRIRSGTSLSRLHLTIQALMEWENYHLYQFQIDEKIHGPALEDDDLHEKRESVRIRLSTVFKEGLDTIVYEYDFGDGWEIEIKLEEVMPMAEQAETVKCVGGARHGPLEDSGGPLGYMEKLKVLKDHSHPDY